MDAAPRHAAHAARRALTQFTDEPCKRGSLTQHVAQEYAGGNWHRFAARATGRFELKKRRDLSTTERTSAVSRWSRSDRLRRAAGPRT